MKVTFQGKEWDTKKKYYAAGREIRGVWQPYDDAGDLEGDVSSSTKECRIVRFFFDMESGELESILLRVVESSGYHVIRAGWVPEGFIDTTEKKVLANIKRLRPKQPAKKPAPKEPEKTAPEPASKTAPKAATKPASRAGTKKADTLRTAKKAETAKKTAAPAAKTAAKTAPQKSAQGKTRASSRKGATNAKK